MIEPIFLLNFFKNVIIGKKEKKYQGLFGNKWKEANSWGKKVLNGQKVVDKGTGPSALKKAGYQVVK